MKIAIDCRFWGLEHTGIGRYTMRLIKELSKIDQKNEYFLLVREKAQKKIKQELDAKNFHLIIAEARHYSFKEQILIPKILKSIKPDVYHAVDINIPVFNFLVSKKTRLVVTIHDLTRQASIGAKVTTLPLPVYWLKYLVTKYWVMKQVIGNSSAIIVPSKFVKKQLIDQNHLLETKIYVTLEAPKEIYFNRVTKQCNNKVIKQLLSKYELKPRGYLIYTGNAYPHKNLKKLIEVMHSMKGVTLAIVCGRNIFRKKIEELVSDMKMEKYIKFLGFVPDEKLKELYRQSSAFITPSLLEGFGLSGLEAMAAGTPVLSSNVSCLPEIYGDVATYFNPYDSDDICEKIKKIIKLSNAEREKIIEKGIKYAKKFSWERMAEETFEIYESISD